MKKHIKFKKSIKIHKMKVIIKFINLIQMFKFKKKNHYKTQACLHFLI